MSQSNLSGKRVLVTGAAGFIGYRLVGALLGQGASVTGCVNPGQEPRIAGLNGQGRLSIVACSLANAQAVWSCKEAFRDIDMVAHLWLRVPSGKDFLEAAPQDVTANITGALNLLKALDPPPRGICFSSSVQVYGKPAVLPVKEDSRLDPLSSYAATKLAIESYLNAYSHERSVPVTVMRYSTVYGPGEKSHRAIPNFLWALAEGQAPTVYGDGSEVKDYVYVDDVVSGTLLALEKNCGGTLNIASGSGSTALEVAHQMTRLCGLDIAARFAPRSAPRTDVVCDISAAKKALGYEPSTLMSQGLAKEIDWFEHEVLCRPLASSRNEALR